MLQQLLAPQLVVLYVLVGCAVYVHFRGRERLRFARQIGDHSTYLAPYNVHGAMFAMLPPGGKLSEPAKGSRCAPSLPPGGSMANMAPWTIGIEFRISTVFGQSERAEGRKSSYHFR